MFRPALTRALAAAVALTVPTLSSASVPSPANSTLPACMALCPMGDISFNVVVRDLANNPVLGSMVVLDFSGCPNGATICPFSPADPYIVDFAGRTLRRLTGTGGAVTFPARVGGTGPAGCVRVFADGVLLKTYALASPDQNGDGFVGGFVNSPDVPTFNAKLGSNDPTADFDCSAFVDFSDQVIFYQHLSQSCDGYVDAAGRKTWGALKLFYR